jgi:hypothetical protein
MPEPNPQYRRSLGLFLNELHPPLISRPPKLWLYKEWLPRVRMPALSQAAPRQAGKGCFPQSFPEDILGALAPGPDPADTCALLNTPFPLSQPVPMGGPGH